MERSKRIWRTPLSSPPDLRSPPGRVFLRSKGARPRGGHPCFFPGLCHFSPLSLASFSDAYYHEGMIPRLPCPPRQAGPERLMFREDGQRAPRPPVPAPLSLLPPAPDGAARPALPGLSADAALAGGDSARRTGEFFGVCVSPLAYRGRCGSRPPATNSPAAGAMR
mgnify:CR=1 FL=1